MEKIEELTLYTIDQEKKLEESEAGRQKLEAQNSQQERMLTELLVRIEKLERNNE